MTSRLLQLNESILYEITKALALPQVKPIKQVIRLLFGKATLRFSGKVLKFDEEIQQNGVIAGARWLLPSFVLDFSAQGTELIPQSGPLIIASNHPASVDGIVISAYISRPDYKVVIGEIPPYQYLPGIRRNAVFSPNEKDTFGRMQTVRNIIYHLKNGGAVLIFPRGGIEPDPAFMPNPDAEFHKWSRSLEIFLKHVPTTQILITAVSGVISEKCFHHPITWFRKSRPDKQRLAFMYQMIRQALYEKELFGLQPRVTFGELLSSLNHKNRLAVIEEAAKRTMKKHLSLFHQN